MGSLVERVEALSRLADATENEQDALVASLVKDLELARSSIRARDIGLAAHLLRRGDELLARFTPKGRPFERAAIMLPYNAVGMAAAISVGGAYLAGTRELIVRLPSRLVNFVPLYRRLVESTLPGVTLTEMSGPEFMSRCFADPAVGAIQAFGDDRWIGAYENATRRTGKKLIFEGPGKDPFIVFADADLEAAASGAVRASYANAGQSCSSPERFYVHEDVREAFLARIVELTKKFRVGAADDEATDVGPTGSVPALLRLREQFEDARAKGARFLIGGELVRLDGNRFETCLPTVLDGCTHQMRVMREESFGPLIPVMGFRETEEVLELAEDSRYGLTATVYGGAPEVAERLRRSHGTVFHNSCIVDPENASCRLFWGGYKNSGWIWETVGVSFIRREGPRSLVEAFTPSAAS